jgi:hypothetical protein
MKRLYRIISLPDKHQIDCRVVESDIVKVISIVDDKHYICTSKKCNSSFVLFKFQLERYRPLISFLKGLGNKLYRVYFKFISLFRHGKKNG